MASENEKLATTPPAGDEVPTPKGSDTVNNSGGSSSERDTAIKMENEKGPSDEEAGTAPPAGDVDQPDPMSHLPEDEAAILKLQADTTERTYSMGSLYRYSTTWDIMVIVVSSIAAIAAGAALPAMTIIFGGIQEVFQDLALQETTISEFKEEMAGYVLYFVYIAVATFAATYIANMGFIYTGERITGALRQKYLESCLRQNIGFFDKVGAGEVTVKITSDIHAIQQGISEKLSQGISSVSTLASGLIIGFIFSWKLTLILMSTFVALVINTSISAHFMVKFSGPAAITFAQACAVAEEAFSAIRVVTAFGNQKRLVEQYEKQLKVSQTPSLKLKIAMSMMMSVIMCLLYLNYGLGFWQGSTFLRRGEIGLQDLVVTLMAVMTGSFNAGSIGPNFQSLFDAIGRNGKLLEIIDRETPIDYTSREGIRLPEVKGDIRMENIKLIYPSRPDVTVMDNLTLDFPAGKVTALVGASGSGKSSIVGLLERFYSPIKGQIYLDGYDLTTLNLQWLRRQIALVGQEPVLFASSVYDNIRNGLVGSEFEHIPEREQRRLVEEAAVKANAHEFITQLPEGYDTDMGGRGLLFSGGQKQRIAIARAVISNPRILLLDEATSALDTKSEVAIQEALQKVSQGRTTITIAHRLSTIRDAHNIVVMSGGKIVEQGTHHELVEAHGSYYELVNAQQVSSEKDEARNALEKKIAEDEEKVIRRLSRLEIDVPTPDLEFTLPPSLPADLAEEERARKEPQADQKYSRLGLVHFVYSFNRHEYGLLALSAFICIICGAANPVQSVFFAKQMLVLVNFGAPGLDDDESQKESDFWSLMYLMLGIVQFFAYTFQGIAFGWCAEKLTSRIRAQTLAHMLRQDVTYFDRGENSSGALSAFLSMETMQMANITGASLSTIIIAFTTMFAGTALAIAIGWKLALVCFSLVPLLLVSGFFQYYILYRYQFRAGKAYAESAGYAAEYVSAMPTVASLTLENKIAKTYKDSLAVQKKRSLLSVAKSSALLAASNSMVYFCLGLGFWYGSTLLAEGEYTIFQFFICLMGVIFGAQSAGTVFTFLPEIVKAQSSAGSVRKMFDREPEIDTWSDKGGTLVNPQGRVELRNVHFRYATRPEKPVLRGVDMIVEPGQHVALFGASGCGKSTIISLLERFYDPIVGQVLVDDHDISQLQTNQYRSQIALVSQQPVLYQGTIRDNILAGQEGEVSDEAMEAACRDANIYDFIVSMPEGFDTSVGIGGALLSGGQKQRIAIARALIRSPKILLLDEATSALDSESEHVVQAALDRAAKGRTTITVAHRISTIRNADLVYVIDGGRVVESGQHTKLMNLNGRYAELVRMQAM